MIGMTTVESSVLAAIGYDTTNQELWVEFRSGLIYYYLGVPAAAYQAFLSAPSKGAYFNQHIRNCFLYFRQL